MIGTRCITYAAKPDEAECVALSAGDYPVRYAEKIDRILANVKNDVIKRRVRNTLGIFERDSGLYGVYLGGNSDLRINSEGLWKSRKGGRTVFVRDA